MSLHVLVTQASGQQAVLQGRVKTLSGCASSAQTVVEQTRNTCFRYMHRSSLLVQHACFKHLSVGATTVCALQDICWLGSAAHILDLAVSMVPSVPEAADFVID